MSWIDSDYLTYKCASNGILSEAHMKAGVRSTHWLGRKIHFIAARIINTPLIGRALAIYEITIAKILFRIFDFFIAVYDFFSESNVPTKTELALKQIEREEINEADKKHLALLNKVNTIKAKVPPAPEKIKRPLNDDLEDFLPKEILEIIESYIDMNNDPFHLSMEAIHGDFSKLTPKQLAGLKFYLPMIHRLNLSQIPLDQAKMNHLIEWFVLNASNNKIETPFKELIFSFKEVNDPVMEVISNSFAAGFLPYCKSLSVDNNSKDQTCGCCRRHLWVSEKGMGLLGKAKLLSQLTSFEISPHANATNVPMLFPPDHFRGMHKLTDLNILMLLTDVYFTKLLKVLDEEKIRLKQLSIPLSHNFSSNIFKSLGQLGYQLDHLELREDYLWAENLAAAAENGDLDKTLKNTKTCSLGVASVWECPHYFAFLASKADLSNVVELVIKSSPIVPRHLEDLAKFMPNLKTLILEECKPAESLIHVESLAQFQKLETLTVYGDHRTWDWSKNNSWNGLIYWGPLLQKVIPKMVSLRHVGLGVNKFTDLKNYPALFNLDRVTVQAFGWNNKKFRQPVHRFYDLKGRQLEEALQEDKEPAGILKNYDGIIIQNPE